jgi:hypothetical protein
MNTLKANTNDGWTQTSNQVFWGEIAPCDHVVQIYESDDVFLDLLTGFVSGGVNVEDAVIVIATTSHLEGLEERLTTIGYDVKTLIANSQYIPLDAEQTLGKFMVNGWPDETLFNHIVSDLIGKAKQGNRQVRAFGEMVAILWAKGQVGATVRLEQLWNMFCENEAFCLFCAYPKSGFTQNASESVMHICGAHSKMVAGIGGGVMTDLLYKNVDQKLAV